MDWKLSFFDENLVLWGLCMPVEGTLFSSSKAGCNSLLCIGFFICHQQHVWVFTELISWGFSDCSCNKSTSCDSRWSAEEHHRCTDLWSLQLHMYWAVWKTQVDVVLPNDNTNYRWRWFAQPCPFGFLSQGESLSWKSSATKSLPWMVPWSGMARSDPDDGIGSPICSSWSPLWDPWVWMASLVGTYLEPFFVHPLTVMILIKFCTSFVLLRLIKIFFFLFFFSFKDHLRFFSRFFYLLVDLTNAQLLKS